MDTCRIIGLGTFEATPEMFRLVNQVLRSGRISYGPLSQEFEQRFAEMHGCKYGVLSNSGTSSLLVALQTLKELHGWQGGDMVFVPALTFVATVNVILQLRLKPILIDVDSIFYNIDIDKLGDAIPMFRRRARCILPVHAFGQPAEIEQIKNIAGWSQLKIVEDSCEAMLVERYGYPVGSWGDIGCFSTYIAHFLVTGVGGLSITNNPDYAQYMRSLCNHGIDLSELPTGADYDPTWLARKFKFCRVGHSFRLTEIEAALGLAQLDDLPAIIRKRQRNAAYLTEQLKPFEERLQLPQTGTEHSWMMYCLVCRQNGIRDDLCRYLEQNGIGTRLMLPLTNQPVYRGLFDEDDYPVAKWINANGFYLGIHQGLTGDDLDYVADKIGAFFNER